MPSDLPEPYASMSLTDPRRREYIERRTLQTQRPGPEGDGDRAEVVSVVDELTAAWQSGRSWFQVAVPAAHTRSVLDTEEATAISRARDVGLLLSEAERIGWQIHNVDHVFVPGPTTGLAVGVRLQKGTIAAMITVRRP